MVCQRCFNDEEVFYRAHSDIMDIMVCYACAEDAQNLEITVEGGVDVAHLGPSLSVARLDDSLSRGIVFTATPPRRRRPKN